MFKKFVEKKLQNYVKQYFAKHPEVKLVVVVGSVGKTTSKRAIADVLSTRYRIRMHEGNLNTELGAPCAILGIEYPNSVKNPFVWLSVFHTARQHIRRPTDVDVIIQELGTDHPGDIEKFGKYLSPDIAVVSAVTPEHMEFFVTMEAVAKEELGIAKFSKFVLINRDDVDSKYAEFITTPNYATFGTTGSAEYRFEQHDYSIENGYTGSVFGPEYPEPFPATINVVGEHSLRPAMAAVAVGAKLGLAPSEIAKGLALVRPAPGRMNLLRGIGDTMVIDDSYNSSPAAAAAALQALYDIDRASQRIAIIGDMRELGTTSQSAHEELGGLCDPGLLSWVVTVGPESEKYLAPVARGRGCQVKSFMSSIQAAEFVRSVTEPGAIILAKGSQNTIFVEEAVKLLVDISEESHLVRQSTQWLEIKAKFFEQF